MFRDDCDLALERRFTLTFQDETGALKYWHQRTNDLIDTSPRTDGGTGTWALLDVPGSFALLHAICPVILGVIEACSLERQAVPVKNWTCLPPGPSSDAGDGNVVILVDRDVAASLPSGASRLVLKTSFLMIEAERRPEREDFDALPRALRHAVLVLTVSDALRSGDALSWLRLVRASKILDERSNGDLQVGVSRSSGLIEFRGVLNVSAWPITVFTMGDHPRLLEPVSLRLSELDEDGEVLFSLVVQSDGWASDPPNDIYLLATDTIHCLAPR